MRNFFNTDCKRQLQLRISFISPLQIDPLNETFEQNTMFYIFLQFVQLSLLCKKNSMVIERELSSNQEGDMPASSYPPLYQIFPSSPQNTALSLATSHKISRRRNRKEEEKDESAEFPFRPFSDAPKTQRKSCAKGFHVSLLSLPSTAVQFQSTKGTKRCTIGSAQFATLQRHEAAR